MTTDDETIPVAPYKLSTWLGEHQRGTLDIELGELLRTLIGEVDRLDKKGSITLTILAEKNSDFGINLAGEVASKLPKDAPVPSFYFIADDHTPTRRDPQQPLPPARDDIDRIFPESTTKD